MTYYQCKNCNYKTDAFACIKKHCFAKIRCKPVINDFVKLSRDQSIIYSLLPHTIDTDYYNISVMKDYENIYKNRKLLEARLSDKNMKKQNVVPIVKLILIHLMNYGHIYY